MPEKKKFFGKALDFRVIYLVIAARLLHASFWLVSTIFLIIKWLLAPFVLVGQLLFLWPFVVLKASFPNKIDAKTVSENDLADDVWQRLQEQKDQLCSVGFAGKNKILSANLADENTRNYIYPMVNESSQLAVGLNYAVLKDAKGEYSILDMAFIEFTVMCSDGGVIDFHNNEKDILQSFDNRQRYYFREDDPFRFYKIVEAISQKNGCTSSQKSINLLKNNPLKIFQEEAEIGFQAMEDNNIIYSVNGRRRLRWFGGLKVIAHSFWPMKTWCEHRKYTNTLNYLESLGVNLETLTYYDDCEFESSYNDSITTLDMLQNTLDDSRLQFGFSPEHKVVSVVFYLDESLVDIVNVVVKMQEVTHFYSRNRSRLSHYELDFENSKRLCTYDGFGRAVYDAELYEIEEPLGDLTQFISVQKVVDIANENMDLQIPDDTSLTLMTKDNRVVWEVYFQKNETYQIIKVDALNSDILFKGKKENLYDL